MNSINLIGKVTEKPEIQERGELKIAKFSLAVSRNIKKDSGKQDVDFIPCSALGSTAEWLERNVGKGQQIGVVGKLRINRYQKDGENKTFTEVTINEVYFAGDMKKE